MCVSMAEAATPSPTSAPAEPMPQHGGMCFTNRSSISEAEVTWNCEHIGRVTMRQIYEKGFRVVGVYSTDPADKIRQFPFLVIEEQRR